LEPEQIIPDHNQGLKIAFVGDTSDSGVGNISLDPEIGDVLRDADVMVWNCEAPILPEKMRPPFSIRKSALDLVALIFGNKQPRVVSTPRIAEIMRIAKINIASLAANHTLDAGGGNIEQTIRILKKAGHLVLGAGKNIFQALKPLETMEKGVRIGMVNYNLVGWNAPLLGYMDVYSAGRFWGGGAPYRESEAQEKVKRLKKRNDLVIASIHMGRCNEERLKNSYLEIAESFFDWGTDIVIVHHSHAMGGIQAREDGKLAILGLGDFIFNRSPYPEYITFYFITILWEKEKGFRVKGYPIIRENGVPKMADAPTGGEITQRLFELCKIEKNWELKADEHGRWSLARQNP